MVPVALALGAGIAWGCSDFLAGVKARRLALLWVLLVSQASGLVLVLAAALVLGEALPSGEAALVAAGAGVAELIGFAAFYRALAANTMFAIALTLGMASIVSVLGSLYPLATVVLARAILHEQVTAGQRTGVLAALAGIGLVSLA